MIVQEINLYQDRFKEKKIWLSASQLLLLGLVVAAILAFSSYWYDQQYQQAKGKNDDFIASKQQATQVQKRQQEKLAQLLANNQINSQIAKISTDISVRKRIIDFVSNNQFGDGKGFADQLSGLSDITVNNVWLNEISMAEDYMKLSGSALRAEKIPEYFNLFKQRQLFKGRVFDVFELDRGKERDWKVDFLIASRVASDE